MRQDFALARLRDLENSLRNQGVSALYLFGSVARDRASDASDIDLAFDVARSTRFSLFDQARIGHQLADALNAEVDFVPLEGMRPALRRRVAAEMVRVF